MTAVWILLVAVATGVVAWWLTRAATRKAVEAEYAGRVADTRAEAEKHLAAAREEATRLREQALVDARRKANRIHEEEEEKLRALYDELHKAEEEFGKREDTLKRMQRGVAERERDLNRLQKKADAITLQQTEKLKEIETRQAEYLDKLEKVASLTAEEAKAELVEMVKGEARHEAAHLIREIREQAQQEGEDEARKIITLAIERLAVETVSARSTFIFPLPDEKLKGRIIGPEGKNVKAFEAETGVQLMMNDQESSVTISGFNPIKREVAKRSLEKLIKTDNVHPRKIEEIVSKENKRVAAVMRAAAEDTLDRLKVGKMHPELVRLIGHLRFRTSYGQNVLDHTYECAKISAQMAAELGYSAKIGMRAGLLHDIGKAVDFETEGTHPELGLQLCEKYGEDPLVAHAAGHHHDDMEASHPYTVIVSAADAISGGRPGARRQANSDFAKRMKQFEEIAHSFRGIDNAYAIQAGRELRLIVRPGDITDADMPFLASEVAKKIQADMDYPGKIKVTVIREFKATQVVH